jgi:hypothetical protein
MFGIRLNAACDYKVPKCDHETITILHERMHACGSGEVGGNPGPGPAQNRAACLFPKFGSLITNNSRFRPCALQLWKE